MAFFARHVRPEVKFCGLTRGEDVDSAVELGASYVGFVFADSPRRTTAASAHALGRHLPDHVRRVGVFQGQSRQAILDTVGESGVDVVQLHDAESTSLGAELRAQGLVVWRVVPVTAGALPRDLPEIIAAADAILLDTRVGKRTGGTGVPFAWERVRDGLEPFRSGCRVVVAGGLHADNVAAAIAALDPDVVDVSSGVEAQPGVKDRGRMRAFLQAVRRASLS